MAFSARKTSKKIDIPLYIILWEDFLQTYYPSKLHKESSLESQLKQHIDFGQRELLPNYQHYRERNKEKGS